jgi:hypothetical protein
MASKRTLRGWLDSAEFNEEPDNRARPRFLNLAPASNRFNAT